MKKPKLVGRGLSVETGKSEAKSGPSIGRDVQTKIGQQLRAMYDDVVQQGIPDRFVELLNLLDKENEREEIREAAAKRRDKE